MIESFLTLLVSVSIRLAAIGLFDIGVQFGVRALFKRRLLKLETALFFLLVTGAVVSCWVGIAPALRISALCLILFGVICYLQCKSFFSRGYSIRILVDLLDSGGKSTLNRMKSEYGHGMGITGMLSKRFDSMASLGLVRFQGDTIGPLSSFGRVFARLGELYRQLLRLDKVG